MGVFNYIDKMIQEPVINKPSVGRFGMLWSLVVLTPAMITLTCFGLFPANQIALVLGAILGAPALVQGMGYLRRGPKEKEERTPAVGFLSSEEGE